MPDPFQLSAQINAPSVQDFSALSAKMDALRSGVQPMQGAAQVDDGWGAVDQSLNIAPKMPVLPAAPGQPSGGFHLVDNDYRHEKQVFVPYNDQITPEFQKRFDQSEYQRIQRVAGIKARAAAEDVAGVIMYRQGGDNNQLDGVLSPAETAARFNSYMVDHKATPEQARAYFADVAMKAEVKHQFFYNKQRMLQGLPPAGSQFNREQFLKIHSPYSGAKELYSQRSQDAMNEAEGYSNEREMRKQRDAIQRERGYY